MQKSCRIAGFKGQISWQEWRTHCLTQKHQGFTRRGTADIRRKGESASQSFGGRICGRYETAERTGVARQAEKRKNRRQPFRNASLGCVAPDNSY